MWDFVQIRPFSEVSEVHCCCSAKASLEYTGSTVKCPECVSAYWMYALLSLLFACSKFKPYSLNSDLLWSTSWILLQASTWSSCTPLQEHGWWSTVARVARKATLHSGSSPRRSPGSISPRHPSRLKSLWLHCSSSWKLQHLVWKVFNISLAGQEGTLLDVFFSALLDENTVAWLLCVAGALRS